MMNNVSDSTSSSGFGGSPVMNELRELASVWSSPVGMFRYLRRLITERPLVGIAASVLVGAVLGGRYMRRRSHA